MLSQTIKNKYEAIFGFVTLVISLSAFKDELEKVNVDLRFINFTLAGYFLWVIYGFCLCLYLYIVEHMVRETAIGNWRFFDWMTRAGFFIFILTLSSPILLVVMLVMLRVFAWIGSLAYQISYPDFLSSIKDTSWFSPGFISITGLIASLVSSKLSNLFYKAFKANKKYEAEEEEIIALDTARKLLDDGYYSQSLLETFKALTFHLYKKLLEREINVSPNRFDDILKLSLREKLIHEDDRSLLADLRGIRNATAHTNIQATKEFAHQAFNFVNNLISLNN